MAPKTVVAAASKGQRKQFRQALGSLDTLVVSTTTQKRYDAAVKGFFKWVEFENRTLPEEISAFDLLLSDYVSHLWEEGEGRAMASDVVAGMQFFRPQLKRHLPCTWRLVGAWAKHELPMRAPPLTPDILESICGVCLQKGLPAIAVCMMVAFYGLLRTGEM